jgi:N-acetylmuramoyl-L-alanine amidase
MQRRNLDPVRVLAIVLALAGAAPGALARSAYLHSATFESEADAPTLVLSLSTKVKARVYTLEKPHRVVIDLAGTRSAAGFRPPAPRGPVTVVRTAQRPDEGYRLVIELPGARAAPQVASQAGAGGYQLRVALAGAPTFAGAAGGASAAAAETDATASNVTAASATLAASKPVPAVTAARTVQPAHGPGRNGRDVIIVVDAGHGGEDPGAIGPGGTREKDVTLDIARALAARINEQPGMRAVLTRDSDRLIDLRERFERARQARADLFVAIHADSVRDRSVTGASVYTLSYHGASSEAAKRLADRENATVLKGGISLASVDPNLASVLLDAAQSQIMGQSVEAADAVLDALDQVGAVRKRVVQHAGFVVLKSPDLPSMLVETAYISNPAEERKLRSSDYQQRLAEAIQAGVERYFRQHPPDGSNYANARGRVGNDSGV